VTEEEKKIDKGERPGGPITYKQTEGRRREEIAREGGLRKGGGDLKGGEEGRKMGVDKGEEAAVVVGTRRG